jgi:hypothetical protein
VSRTIIKIEHNAFVSSIAYDRYHTLDISNPNLVSLLIINANILAPTATPHGKNSRTSSGVIFSDIL